MRIDVRLGEPLWRSVGAARFTLDFAGESISLAQVLDRLRVDYPAFAAAFCGDGLGHAWPYRLFVNARHVVDDQQRLVDGDRLAIFLPAVGGSGAGQPLPRRFYAQPTLTVARALLGQRLVRSLDGRRLSGRVIEVEAYVGEDDLASHAARGRTPRNRAMYSQPGLAYVYFIYGMYFCLNVVTEADGYPAAVLIRGLEPLEGVEEMTRRRAGRPRLVLTDGPGKLCQALAIDRVLDGHDLTVGVDLWLEAGASLPDEHVLATPRIGVTGDSLARTRPWRFIDRQAVRK